MPKGIKGSGEPTKKRRKASPKVVPMVAPEPVKVKKPYPTHEERIKKADEQIQHWETLNAKRRELVAKTEKLLVDRQEDIARGEAELIKAMKWKQRLVEITEGTPNGEKGKYKELMAALEVKGKSVDDLLKELRGA
ncbi:hypothetical protein FACS1894184_15340 [Clostridia bacterium]|nr:hypothetical protein FACS1894184_15340 [Clostridia bacterium]